MEPLNELRRVAQAGKDTDPSWYRVHRRLSIHLTRLMLAAGFEADHASFLMMLTGAAGAALLVPASPAWNLAGGALLYLSFLLDKVDGEIARWRRTRSLGGILLDRFHHRIVEPLLFIAAGVHAYRGTHAIEALVAGFATAMLANIIEENQQLAPFVLFKHLRDGGGIPGTAATGASRGLAIAASALRPLKAFRMLVVALPLLLVAGALEVLTGRALTGPYLIVSAAALATYLAFQCVYYFRFQLQAETAAVARAFLVADRPDAAGHASEGRTAELGPTATRIRVLAAPRRERSAALRQTRNGHGPWHGSVAALALGLLGAWATLATAATYWVNGTSSSCSSAGPGTPAAPYCTIGGALTAHHVAGDTIAVLPAVYPEQITVPASGTSGSPIVILAAPVGFQSPIIECANDFSNSALWNPYSGSVYLCPTVNWSPVQVFLDDARCARSTLAPASIPPGSFRYIAGDGLYFNVGGDNPGAHHVLVGRRTYGFTLSARSWVCINGFTIVHAEDRGIQIAGGSSNIEVVGNRISLSARYGIQAASASALHIAGNKVFDNGDHGIALTSAVTGSLIEDNESFRNVYAPARQANGVFLAGSSGNTIQRNRFHDNQDTGLHMQGNATNNLSIQNQSWNNGDHGFDTLDSPSNIHINDVAWGNYVDGFSFEGASTECRMWNSISAENGLTANGADLRLSAQASVGFISNDNVYWNSTSQPPYNYSATPYSNLSDFSAASGTDSRSIQADPLFVNPSGGDFHLLAGSPAIDNANTSVANWPATDADGRARADDPAVPNQGLGPVTYADRGALEYVQGVASVGPDPFITGAVSFSPNPFRPAVTRAALSFSTARSGALSVLILDASGRAVQRLLERPSAPAGRYFLALDGRRDDGRPLASGVYFYLIRSPEESRTGRFAVLR